jgi:hypothetical protein
MMEATRPQAAGSAWERAQRASRLRHVALAKGDRRTARALSEIKKNAVKLAARLLPEAVEVAVDTDYHIGFLSIRFAGRGALHLPSGEKVATIDSNVGTGA